MVGVGRSRTGWLGSVAGVDVTFVPVTVESLDAELASDVVWLASRLAAEIVEWPPIGGEWDRDAIERVRSVIELPTFDGRFGAFYVLVDQALVANAGFFGPPDNRLEVEIGYSTCQHFRRRGIAIATIAELCRRAAAFGCSSVRARVKPYNTASIKALQRNDFVEVERDVGGADEFVLLRRRLAE
jgi:RimJ/RimL family protein N-acetyltransferase